VEVENAMDGNRQLSQPGQLTAANAPEECLLGIAEKAEKIYTQLLEAAINEPFPARNARLSLSGAATTPKAWLFILLPKPIAESASITSFRSVEPTRRYYPTCFRRQWCQQPTAPMRNFHVEGSHSH
jgi:hypothetical protein